MDFYTKYKSPLGYQTGEGQIDTYGVDHSGFSTRDELEYQFSRQNKENQLIRNYNNQGITKNYPQYGTNFWNNPNNNYGFGSSNIHDNVENLNNNPFENMVNNILENSNNVFNSSINNNSIFSPNNITSSTSNPQQNAFNTLAQPYQLAQNSLPNSGSDAASSNIDYSLYGNDFSKEFIDEMVNNKEYQRALQEYAIPNEGGYVNDPQDPGGETKFGISKRYHPNEDIKNLTRERANALLFKETWNWNGINTLPSEIRGFVFDHGIRTSPQNAIETTHSALGINPVGDIIGKTTLSRLKNMDYNEFLHKYKELVKEQDKQRSGYGRFGTGWDNRTEGYHISN